MADTVNKVKPTWELTVRDFFVHFKANEGGGTETDMQMPVIKELRVQPNENTRSIYASGVVYDTVTQLAESKAGLTAVALPREFTDRALGAKNKGAVSYDTVLPVKEEFACGYWCENQDGSATYYYHPRCKLVQSDATHRTYDSAQTPDPSVAYDILLLGTDEKVWRVRYFTASVEEGKVPLTPAEFFALHPETIEDIEAIPGTEKAAAAQ